MHNKYHDIFVHCTTFRRKASESSLHFNLHSFLQRYVKKFHFISTKLIQLFKSMSRSHAIMHVIAVSSLQIPTMKTNLLTLEIFLRFVSVLPSSIANYKCAGMCAHFMTSNAHLILFALIYACTLKKFVWTWRTSSKSHAGGVTKPTSPKIILLRSCNPVVITYSCGSYDASFVICIFCKWI